jgi:hypothetical protein
MKFGWHDPCYTLLQGKINLTKEGSEFWIPLEKEIRIDFTIV